MAAAAAAAAPAAATTTTKEFTFEQFEELCGPQLVGSGVPHCLWACIFSKLKKQVFDAGDVFALAEQGGDDDDEDEEGGANNNRKPLPHLLVSARDLTADDVEEQVWLLDHAWTFRAREAAPTLVKNEQLRRRVSMMLRGTADASAEDVPKLLQLLWPRAGHYRVATSAQLDEESCWYLLDEVGSAISREVVPSQEDVDKDAADNENEEDGEEEVVNPVDFGANVAMSPLFYPPANMTFSVVWFVEHDKEDFEMEAGTIIGCDMARGLTQDKREATRARLDAVWDESIEDVLRDEEADLTQRCTAALKKRRERLAQLAKDKKAQVDALLNRDPKKLPVAPQLLTNGSGPAKVWTDHEQIREFLTLPASSYVLVDDPSSADIVWSAYTAASPAVAASAKYVAEFNNENRFCNKAMLAQSLHETLGCSTASSSSAEAGIIVGPKWLPTTFDANLELDEFVGQFVENQKRGADNMWISKPHAMARSLDMAVSDDPRFLLRIGETGPKILCKYLERPATLRGRKFDLRLCALVRNFSATEGALEVYLHDKVWVRTAANEYSRSDYHEYEKHFTVMNYAEGGSKLLNLLHDDFIAEFDKDKGVGAWAATYERIKQMLREVFVAISVAHGDELEEPFHGSPPKHAHRRALYGIDLMLDEELRPFLLEITFSPDINRACKFFPSFVNDVFKTLFEGNPTSCERLC